MTDLVSTRQTRVVLGALAAGGLIVLLGLFTYVSIRVDTNQRSTTVALCALRSDLQQRVTVGQRFLLRHPRGIPGVPVATIRSSLDNESRTVDALSPIACPG